MKIEETEYLVVYPGHNIAALLYQRLLKRACRVELIATPVKISYGCSQSIKFRESYMDIVMFEIKKIQPKPKGLYRVVKLGKLENYLKL